MDSDQKLVPIWVVGEIDIDEDVLEELGTIDAVQYELGPAGFRVVYAEET